MELSDETIINLYKNKVKVSEIAKKINRAPATVYSILYKNGVEINPVGRPKKANNFIVNNLEIKKTRRINPLNITHQEIYYELKEIAKNVVSENRTDTPEDIANKALLIILKRLVKGKI